VERGGKSLSGNEQLNTISRIVIECFGMPGAGKSYLSTKLGKMLEADGLQVGDHIITISNKKPSAKRVLNKFWLIVTTLWANRRTIATIWKLTRLHRPPNLLFFSKLLINWLFVNALIHIKSRNSDIVLLDQGLSQALWSTKYYGQSKPDNDVVARLMLRLLIDLHIAPLSIIYVSADDSLIKKRIGSREKGSSPLDSNMNEFMRAKAATAQSLSVFELLGKQEATLIITRFDNSGSNSVDDLKLALPHQ
jgi:hypothetical protein